MILSAQEALDRLRKGNRRFVSEVRRRELLACGARRRELTAGQEPFAVILGCSDSREPPEIIFDQTLGDLFVIRVAGNIAAPSQVGSIELAAERIGTRLVVVLGHSQCGAIQATIEELEKPSQSLSDNLRSILDQIRPSVEPLMTTDAVRDRDALVRRAVRANIRVAAERLRNGSAVLRRFRERNGLQVVGAEYSLDTGIVDFFDSEIAPPEGS